MNLVTVLENVRPKVPGKETAKVLKGQSGCKGTAKSMNKGF